MREVRRVVRLPLSSLAVSIVSIVLVVGCAGSETARDVTPTPSTAQPSAASSTSIGDAAQPTAAVDGIADPAEAAPLPTDAADEIGPEITGFPALDDPDAFCRNYALLSQSVYVAGITLSIGDPGLLPPAEVVSAQSIFTAWEALKGQWPAGLEADRPALTAQYQAYLDRAVAALVMLSDVGADDAALARLDADWQSLLAELPVGYALEGVNVNEADRAIVEQAVERFRAEMPARRDDPAVVAGREAPETPLVDGWAEQNCASAGVDSSEGDEVDIGEG